jgi:hypothetical protein
LRPISTHQCPSNGTPIESSSSKTRHHNRNNLPLVKCRSNNRSSNKMELLEVVGVIEWPGMSHAANNRRWLTDRPHQVFLNESI